MDITIDGQLLGRIIFGLFGDIAPKAVDNFYHLCKCDMGKAPRTGKDLCYKNSIIHRVIPNFIVSVKRSVGSSVESTVVELLFFFGKTEPILQM
jgi:cyclophilin family peptidyl-prolyl cis-trans isomerase